jgi:hypothetical protein
MLGSLVSSAAEHRLVSWSAVTGTGSVTHGLLLPTSKLHPKPQTRVRQAEIDAGSGSPEALTTAGREERAWAAGARERGLVGVLAPELVALRGGGTDGTLLVATGSNRERLTHEVSIAALCGISPVDASSGRYNRKVWIGREVKRWGPQQQVHVIKHRVALHHLDVVLHTQFPQDASNLPCANDRRSFACGTLERTRRGTCSTIVRAKGFATVA